MSLFLRICSILLYIAFVVLAYYVAVWVLHMLGIQVPEHILRQLVEDRSMTDLFRASFKRIVEIIIAIVVAFFLMYLARGWIV